LETEKFISTTNRINGEDVLITKNTFSDHGNEIDEIISKKPPFIVRWGTTGFFILLLLILLVSWFIQYPDIVTTKAKLTSLNAPKAIVTRTDGQLIKLSVKEGDRVYKNETIGYMESNANAETIIHLSGVLDSLQNALNNNKPELIKGFFSAALIKSQKELGELQQSYQAFIQSFVVFKSYLETGFYLQKKSLLKTDMERLRQLNVNLYQQKNLQEQDLSLSQQTFNASKQLREENAMSPLEYRTESSKLISKQMNIPQITTSILNNEAQQNAKKEEIMELDNQIAQQKSIFIQSLNTFISQVNEWKKKYLLISPVEGRIAFSDFIQERQQLHLNQTICYVNPDNSEYYAEVYIPQFNLGKVKKGQRVLLKISSYPFEQYGSLSGKIDFISTIPTDSGYLSKVILINGLTTNYNRTIQYREGLVAQGEIITQNMRLPERFFNGIRKQIGK
jgi:multidrug efflux pump subunit AcrA (membrane-fusion protein)